MKRPDLRFIYERAFSAAWDAARDGSTLEAECLRRAESHQAGLLAVYSAAVRLGDPKKWVEKDRPLSADELPYLQQGNA